MASKRHQRRRECEGKRGYPTPDAAHHRLRDILSTGSMDPSCCPLHSYHCPHCGRYHVGRVPTAQMRAIGARA